MKMKNYFYAMMACVALTFSACDKDKNENNNSLSENSTVDDIKNQPYSDLTPEQQKEKLATEANAFINEMKGLSEAKCPEVLEALFNLMDNTDLPEGLNSKIESIEDITAINEFYGKYTWNNGAWDESVSTDKLVIEFPVGNSTTNNGKIEVTGEKSNYTVEGVIFPKQLTAKIFLNSAQCGSIEANGDALKANDELAAPATASVTITIDGYTIAQSFTKSDATAKLTLKKGNTQLITTTAKLDGNIDNMIQNEQEPNGGNFSMMIMDNLMLAGTIDYANYAKGEEALENLSEENEAKAEAELINKYFEVYLASAKDNTKIAKLVVKAASGQDEYYTYWDIAPCLKFNDNTEVEMEVYFTKGFDAVIENFNGFIESLGINFDGFFNSEDDDSVHIPQE